MPYTYKKEGDKYVVYKKDGGQRVGATAGNKTALNKYLGALHSNAMEEANLRKFIRNLIMEDMESNSGNIENELSSVFKQFVSSLPKAKKEEQIQNEELMTIAGISLALPGIIKIISFFGKKASQIINKKFGNKISLLKDSEQWFSELMHTAEHLHHLYLKPIEYVVKKAFGVKDEQKAYKISNIIFHSIVAVMLVSSGIGAIKAFKAKELSAGTLESALSAVKTGELNTFISSAISEIQ